MSEDRDVYYIGLTMAGAISAGAYTAGVLDTLFDALDRHNTRYAARKKAEAANEDLTKYDDYPRHQVKLRVISGTSAGGVSAGLAVAGLIDAREAEDGPDGREMPRNHKVSYPEDLKDLRGVYDYEYKLKPLHSVWIEDLDLYRDPPTHDESDVINAPKGVSFLSTDDLKEDGQPVAAVSALNSLHIDKAADKALQDIRWRGGTYRFLNQDLDVFLTTTNLQGVPYEVGFSAAGEGTATHGMAQHSTIRHFRISNLGRDAHPSPWLDAWDDRGINLPLVQDVQIQFDWPDVPEGQPRPPSDQLSWPKFKTAAIATGAFPVGLAPRKIRAEAQDFGILGPNGHATGGAWPVDMKPGPAKLGSNRPRPRLLPDPTANIPAEMQALYVAVDGGVANNEPFELARFTLREEEDPDIAAGQKYLLSNPRDAEQAHRAVLMVDPFPEGPTFKSLSESEASSMRRIFPAASKLLPALINQARFKPVELLQASQSDIASRYLLAPKRRGPKNPDFPEEAEVLHGAKAIASGSFGGFGGFFHRSFRAHDYMLGQLNCQSFLDNHFCLAATNPLLSGDRTADPVACPDRLPKSARTPGMVRILNAGGDMKPKDAKAPLWPVIGGKHLTPIISAAETRVRDVGASIVKFSKVSLFEQIILRGVWGGAFGFGLSSAVSGALGRIMVSELIERDQHQDYRSRKENGKERPLLDWERAALVMLANAGSKPVPLVMPDDERNKAKADGEEIVELVKAIQPEGGTRLAAVSELKDFLDALTTETRGPDQPPRVWKAPAPRDDVDLYLLTLWQPKLTGLMRVRAWGGRLRRSIFG